MKKYLFLLVILAMLAFICTAAFADDAKQLAGWYVSFNEDDKAVLDRGIIGIRDGVISEI